MWTFRLRAYSGSRSCLEGVSVVEAAHKLEVLKQEQGWVFELQAEFKYFWIQGGSVQDQVFSR